jgi:hypothetical protein
LGLSRICVNVKLREYKARGGTNLQQGFIGKAGQRGLCTGSGVKTHHCIIPKRQIDRSNISTETITVASWLESLERKEKVELFHRSSVQKAADTTMVATAMSFFTRLTEREHDKSNNSITTVHGP